MSNTVSHIVHMIHGQTGMAEWMLKGVGGYLDRLDDEIKNGEWMHPETTAMIQLASDEKILRDLANELRQRRADLLANQPANVVMVSAAAE